MSWDDQVRAVEISAQLNRYKLRRRAALDIVHRGVATVPAEKQYASISGGKDSVAMLSVLQEAGWSGDCAVAITRLSIPNTLETARAAIEQAGCTPRVVRPADLRSHVVKIRAEYGVAGTPCPLDTDAGWTEWDVLAAYPRDIDITDPRPYELLMCAFGAGNMLVAYQYQARKELVFTGLRAEESKGRLLDRNVHGPIWQYQTDGSWGVKPIIGWSGLEVLGTIVRDGLPLHPHYRMAWEAYGGRVNLDRIRVDMVITRGDLAAQGTMWPVARLYPELWHRITDLRPEMMRYA